MRTRQGTVPTSAAASRSRADRPEPKEKPRGHVTRAVAFVSLILILFVASFSQSAQIVESAARPTDSTLEASVRRAAQSAASQSQREAVGASAAVAPAATPAATPKLAEQQPRPELTHEVSTVAALPAPFTPLLPAPAALNLPAKCHAREHTELEGTVVQWGSSHKKPDAASCCDACEAHATANPSRPCNVWVHCSDEALCGSKLGECWLKQTPDPSEAPSRGGGSKVPWTAGALIPAGGAKSFKLARRWARAAQQRAPLTVLHSAEMAVGLRNESGTIELLTPSMTPSQGDEADPGLSYTLPLTDPEINLGRGAFLDRTADGFTHLGDLSLQVAGGPACTSVGPGAIRAQKGGPGGVLKDFKPGDGGSALWQHTRPVALVSKRGGGGGEACGALGVRRELTARRASAGGGLEMRLEITNRGEKPLTLSALGLAMAFDQNFVGRNLPQVAAQASFAEPFLGGGGGYVQVSRATGLGPVLLLTPLNEGSSFEAWRPLRNGEDAMRLDFMYEMSYELMLHSQHYAEGAWRQATPWNPATSASLAPGESRSYGVALHLAPNLQRVEETLLRAGRLVATPLPGPLLALDMTNATLLLDVPWAEAAVTQLTAHPPSALRLVPRPLRNGGAPGWCSAAYTAGCSRLRYSLLPLARPSDGRVRLQLSVARPASMGGGAASISVHLFLAQPAKKLIATFGEHGATKTWLPAGTADPWHRDGAFFGWDAVAGARATQERRVYMSGLSDEAGAGAGLAMAVKQLGAPSATEVGLLEQYVRHTLYQGEHPERGHFLQASADDSVRLSLLYWTDAMSDPSSAIGKAVTAAAPGLASVCRRCWPKSCSWMDCWSEEHSLESWRAYNYPHVTAVYWSLYRLGRYYQPPLIQQQNWSWYLTRAHATAVALWTRGGDPWTKKQGGGVGTAQWGVMVGSVFELLLADLWREGWEKEARQVQETVEKRMATWLKMPFPYGSEFSWDSTGHEEISTWMLRFGKAKEARQTLDAVAAYVSLTPHWAYCGSARRWWDFTINGHTQRGNERVMHHYAAALNSIPFFDHALRSPSDPWLWRLAQCAGGGTLSNIRPDGSASMGLHADPDLLHLDGFSADFGTHPAPCTLHPATRNPQPATRDPRPATRTNGPLLRLMCRHVLLRPRSGLGLQPECSGCNPLCSGMGFYGHWKNAGSYLTCSAQLGWLCLGCDLTAAPDAACEEVQAAVDSGADGGELTVVPRDAFGRKLYLQPLGLLLEV